MEIEKIRNYISYFETVNAETACRWEESKKLEEQKQQSMKNKTDFQEKIQAINEENEK